MEFNTVKMYLKEIGQYPLLNGAEELELASIIRDENKSQSERDAAKEKLINCNLRLVVNVAKKYKNNSISLLDLISEGNTGLIIAAEKFNPDYGYRFSTCAVPWIKQAILKALTENSRAIRLPAHVYQLMKKYNAEVEKMVYQEGLEPSAVTDESVAARLNVEVSKINKLHFYEQHMISFDTPLSKDGDADADTVGDLIADSNAETPADYTIRCDEERMIQEAIDTFPERTQTIIRLRYGLGRKGIDPDNFLVEHTLEEVGLYIDLTRERVRQIEKETLLKLKHMLEGKVRH